MTQKGGRKTQERQRALQDWKTWVMESQVIPKEAKPYCLLPSQTEEGIKICG